MRPVVSVQFLPGRLPLVFSIRGQSGSWRLRSCAQCGPNVAFVNRSRSHSERRATRNLFNPRWTQMNPDFPKNRVVGDRSDPPTRSHAPTLQRSTLLFIPLLSEPAFFIIGNAFGMR